MCLKAAVGGSDYSIVLILSILRLQAMKYPLKHKVGAKKKCILFMTQIVLLSMSVLGFYLVYYVRGTIVDFQNIGYLVNGILSSLTIGVVTCVLYTLFEIRKHMRNDSMLFHKSMLKNHKRSAGTLLIIGCFMLFFIVVQFPNFYILHTLLRGSGVLSGKTFRTTKRVTDITIVINLLNTTINSIFIVGRSRKMKRYYRHLLCSFFYNDA